jgi:xanthine/uracil permease
MTGIIRKTIGIICTVIGGLIFFIFGFVSYFIRDFMPLVFAGLILMVIGYLLYPTELARELLEDTFDFDEDGNLQ